MARSLLSSKCLPALLSLALLVGFAPAGSAVQKLPEVSPEGLMLIDNTKAYAVYLQEGVDFSGYDKVALLECYVAFKKNWQREQSFRVSDSDMMKIKNELAEEFKLVYSETLRQKGLEVVDEAGPGVLILRPAIINLDIAAPDVMHAGRSRTFATSAGEMTLFLEAFDGVSGALLARVIDPERAHDYGTMQVVNGVTNKADADRILKKWAEALGDYLARARASGAAQQ